MRVIYKYELKVKDQQYLDLPRGYKILTVQVQKGVPVLWALINTEADTINCSIRMYNTGFPDNGIILDKYISTIQLNDGNFVQHVFEEIT